MSSILVLSSRMQGLQLEDTLEITSPEWTPTAVYETDTTQNGTYNSEPAYEGSGYWIFKSDKYWCKSTAKTNNYWEADVVSLQLGGHGGNLGDGTVFDIVTTDGTHNYCDSIHFNQTASFDDIDCDECYILPYLIIDSTTNTLEFNTFGDIASSLTVFVGRDCKIAFPSTGNQIKSEYGFLIGGNTTNYSVSMNYADNDFASGTRLGVAGNCQTLNAIGQANSVCQLQADYITPSSGTSVNADEVVYDNNYVRTGVEHGISSFMSTAEGLFPASPNTGDLYYEEGRRALLVYGGDQWLVPTEAFPKYGSGDWDSFKLAWGKVLPRYASVQFAEPKISELSGTYGSASSIRWQCHLTLSDGKVLSLPLNETEALLIDPDDDSVSTINFSGNQTVRAAALYEDCVYAYSETASEIIKFDPSDNSVVQCTSNMSGTYYGGILFNAHIYFTQETPTHVIKFDPNDNSTETINYSGNTFSPNTTVNMCLAADNCMYILPYRTNDFIIKFDPSDESFEEIDIDLSSVNTADKHWGGFLNGPDGVMYITPTTSGHEGAYYNPFTGEWGELTGNTAPTNDGYVMGVSHPSGKLLYGPGGDNDAIFIIDPNTKVGETIVKPAGLTAAQRQIQLAGNGHIYGIPAWHGNTDPLTIWKIELGEPMPLDYNFSTSIYIDA